MSQPLEIEISGRALPSSPTLSGALQRQGFPPGGNTMYFGDDFFYYHPPEGTPGYTGRGWEFTDAELLAEVKEDEDEEDQEDERGPPPTAANPPPPELIPDTSEAIAVCLAPDVCRSPDKPVPYQVWGKADDDRNYASSVRSNGDPLKCSNSCFTTTYGDEAGTGLGVKSNTVGDIVEPVTSSPIVRVEGNPVERHGDRVTLNSGNTPGEYIHVNSTETHPAPDGNDEGDKAWYEKAWDDFYAGAHSTSDTVAAGESIWDKAGEYWDDPSQVGRDAESVYESLPTGSEVWEGTKNVAEGAAHIAGEVWDDPRGSAEATGGWLKDQAVGAWEGIQQGYAEHGVMGGIGAAAGIGVEIVNPLKKLRLAERALEAAEAAGDIAKAERLREEVRRLRREAEKARKAEEEGADGARSTKKRRISLRERYLGKTPGKDSRTGREVRERMRKDGELRTNRRGQDEFLDESGVWRPVDSPSTHMGHHPTDAVDYWNETGRFHGAKSPEVRSWMLDSGNYRFEWGPLNSARGGATTSRYLPPPES